MTFEAYRRAVLRELTNTSLYQHFHVTLKAFEEVEGVDQLATDLFPLLKSCYDLDKPVTFTAERVDTLGNMTQMAANLYVAELKLDRRT